MDTLPEIALDDASDPVVLQDGAFCLRLHDRTLPLRMGGAPIESFLSGWRPTFVYAGFAPFAIMQFTSDSGETAAWIVDGDGNRLGGGLKELATDARDALRAAAAPRVARLVDTLLRDPEPSLDPQDRAFLRLPETFRLDIGNLCAATALPPVRRVVLSAAPDGWDDAWGLNRGHVEAILSTPFGERLLQSTEDGMLSWPSPVDGRTLRVQGSLCSDDFRFAYRLADPVHGVVCYPIVSHHHSETLGLYVPALGRLLAIDERRRFLLEVYLPNLETWLALLLCRFGAAIERYVRAGASHMASIMRSAPHVHLGHQLWNELSGIDKFLRSAAGPHLPKWIVPGPETEIWGAVDQLFPRLAGQVDRSASNSNAAIAASYETGACLVRITGEYVFADMRASLQRIVEADPVFGETRQVIESRARPDAPVVLLGLRVENRTMVDLLEFCEELLERVAEAFPGAILVLDGHNSVHDGQVIMSFGEACARRSPSEVERQIAGHLRRLQVGRDITVVDTLGAPIRTSLAWCRQADCFFSVWGASLSKYRWACNKPGLVVTSRWNLVNRTDIHIYDSPDFMETPSELRFVDPALVEDDPKAALLVDVGPGQPLYFNFAVEHGKLIWQILRLIDASLARRPAAIQRQEG